MKALTLIKRVLAPLRRSTEEGAVRPGPYWLPVTGGFLPDGAPMNWWQCGMDPAYASTQSAMVEACVSAYSQTVAMCPGAHWRGNSKNGRDRVDNSSLARVLKKPNDYQSMSDLMLNLVRGLYLTGNAYALAIRNNRYEITELHLMNPDLSRAQVAVDGSVFYHLGGNALIDYRLGHVPLVVPARDVLHVRLHANRRYPHPLMGETPLIAALSDVVASSAMSQSQTNFFLNQSRPSAVLQTDLVLDKDQLQFVRDRWNEQAKGLGSGGVPILTAGLKVQPWAISAKDAELAETLKISEQHIALVYRVPLQILGMAGGQNYSSTELLMQYWISTGLGFCINHVEQAFDGLFGLAGEPQEYVEFDTNALLRSARKDRIEALARGVQGGIYAPNEARALEGLGGVEFGDSPRVQAQVVPLSAAGAIPTAPTSPAQPAQPAQPTKPPTAPKDFADAVRREHQRIRSNATFRRSQRFN